MKKTDEKRPKRRREVVLLRDLAPRKDVAGGSGQIPFGQDVSTEEPPKKDRPKD